MAPSMKSLFGALGVQVDSARLERFLANNSRAMVWVVGARGYLPSGREYGRNDPPCELVFGTPGVVSAVSSVKLKEINPQGKPKEWVQKLDALQCAMCQAAERAKLNDAGLDGIRDYRLEMLMLMVPKEYQMKMTP